LLTYTLSVRNTDKFTTRFETLKAVKTVLVFWAVTLYDYMVR